MKHASPHRSGIGHATAQQRDLSERVVLVDPSDRVVGAAPKLAAHRTGQLHRAFSVLITDQRDRMLLQRRADTKYHFPGLWSNACCGHPRPGEATGAAARRRLQEEFGLALTVSKTAETRYHATDNISGLIEHEYLHIFHGRCRSNRVLHPDPEEIGAWRWASMPTLQRAMRACPQSFTPWFRMLFLRHAAALFARADDNSLSA